MSSKQRPRPKQDRTEEQKQASRDNGAKSHGPVSDEGKQASKYNALKHGLTGRDLLVADQDQPFFNLCLRNAYFHCTPETEVERGLAHRMAYSMVQMERASLTLKQTMEGLVEGAEARWVDGLRDRVEKWDALMCTSKNPREAVYELSRFPAGRSRLIEHWLALRAALTEKHQRWNKFQRNRAIALLWLDPPAAEALASPIRQAWLASQPKAGDAEINEAFGLHREAIEERRECRKELAAGRELWHGRLLRVVDRYLELLERRCVGDEQQVERERAFAPIKAQVELDRSVHLLRRYEAQHERAYVHSPGLIARARKDRAVAAKAPRMYEAEAKEAFAFNLTVDQMREWLRWDGCWPAPMQVVDADQVMGAEPFAAFQDHRTPDMQAVSAEEAERRTYAVRTIYPASESVRDEAGNWVRERAQVIIGSSVKGYVDPHDRPFTQEPAPGAVEEPKPAAPEASNEMNPAGPEAPDETNPARSSYVHIRATKPDSPGPETGPQPPPKG